MHGIAAMSNASQPVRATRLPVAGVRSSKDSTPRLQQGELTIFTTKILLQRPVPAGCGTTTLMSTQARIPRLENVGMPAIAPTGCMPT
jgi:hypothetical protein